MKYRIKWCKAPRLTKTLLEVKNIYPKPHFQKPKTINSTDTTIFDQQE